MNTYDPYELFEALDAEVKASPFSMARVCKEAGVSPSLVSKWRAHGHEPRLSSLERLQAALNMLLDTHAGIGDIL